MEQERFDALVRKLDAVAERTPVWYRVRVALFAVLGHVVYAGLILASVGVLAGAVVFMILKPNLLMLKFGWKLAIPLVLFVMAMLKALKVTHLPPEGVPVTAAQAPELFALIENISKKLRVPRLEGVLLTDEFNAAVVQMPRLGLFGASSHLMLGVPLLQALSKEDVTSVVAHEFGHLSGNHSRFSGLVYRSVRSYVRVLETTGQNKVLEAFLNWYVPRLDALSFPLRRQNEYEADAASAEIVGKARAAQALVNVHVRSAVEPEFWKGIEQRAIETAHPPADLFFEWETQVRAQPASSSEEALSTALKEETGTTNTHPCLRDRLARLDVRPALEDAPKTNAARALLGESYRYYVDQAGLRWSARVHEGWKREHQELAAAKKRKAELEGESTRRALNGAESFELAQAAEAVQPNADALPLYRAVLALEPNHVGARVSAARLLLSREDPEGVELLQPLTKNHDPNLGLVVNALLAQYHQRRGDERAAKESFSRAQSAHEEELERARARQELTSHDRFEPHGLDPKELAKVAEDVALFPAVSRAYLARKMVAGEPVFFVIAVELHLKNRLLDDETLVQRVVETVTLPGPAWCIRIDQNGLIGAEIKAVEGSLVYGRE